MNHQLIASQAFALLHHITSYDIAVEQLTTNIIRRNRLSSSKQVIFSGIHTINSNKLTIFIKFCVRTLPLSIAIFSLSSCLLTSLLDTLVEYPFAPSHSQSSRHKLVKLWLKILYATCLINSGWKGIHTPT